MEVTAGPVGAVKVTDKVVEVTDEVVDVTVEVIVKAVGCSSFSRRRSTSRCPFSAVSLKLVIGFKQAGLKRKFKLHIYWKCKYTMKKIMVWKHWSTF